MEKGQALQLNKVTFSVWDNKNERPSVLEKFRPKWKSMHNNFLTNLS